MCIEQILRDIEKELGYSVTFEVFDSYTRFSLEIKGCCIGVEFSFANSFIKDTNLLQYYITKKVVDLVEYYEDQ